MSDKLNDIDIDKIFRDSIESAEAQPSENFWSKAYEGIIARENSMYQKRISGWRNAAIALGLIVFGLVGYNVYLTGKVDNLGKQVADVQKFQSSNNSVVAQNQTSSNTVAVNNKTNEVVNNNSVTNALSENSQHSFASVNHSNRVNANNASINHISHNQLHSSEHQQNSSVALASNNNASRVTNEVANNNANQVSNNNATQVTNNANVSLASNNANQVSENNSSANQVANNANVSLASNNNASKVSNGTLQQNNVVSSAVSSSAANSNEQQANQNNQVVVADNSSKTANNNTSATEKTQDKSTPATASSDVIFPDVNSSPDSTNSFSGQIASQSKSRFMEEVMPKISISAYIAPFVASPVMNGYSIADNLSSVQLNSREHQQVGYSYGANIGFDISSKVTIEAGFGYRSNQYSISSSVLYPHTGDLTQAYHLVTSSGTITMPYLPNESSGQSVTATGNAVRSYMSIPVQVKYNLLTVRHKFTVYATGGAVVDILSKDNATINYGNANGAGVVTVNSVNGANNFTCAYLLGVGAKYKLGKGFDVYAEPNYIGSVMPINSSAYIKAFSNFYSFTTGLSYHF